MTRATLAALIVMLASISLPEAAEAFHEIASFGRSANTGGGSGSYFTGSRAFKGYDCNICHVDAEQRISVEIESPLRSGQYRPGLIYPITVRLVGEHRGLESAFNPNTFTADMVDASGAPVGRFAAGGGIVELVNDRAVAIAEGVGNGESEWSFSWWAPTEAQSATLFIAMLDGDGASDPDRRFIDPLNDDVATLRLAICPEGETCTSPAAPGPEVAPMGCSAGSGGGRSLWAACLVLLLLGTLIRWDSASMRLLLARPCTKAPPLRYDGWPP